MIAYDGPMPLRFDPQLTAQSVMFAILFFWFAFHAAGRSFRPVASLLTGLPAWRPWRWQPCIMTGPPSSLPSALAVTGVVTLRFMAMSATVLMPDPADPVGPGTGNWLIAAIVAAALGFIATVVGHA